VYYLAVVEVKKEIRAPASRLLFVLALGLIVSMPLATSAQTCSSEQGRVAQGSDYLMTAPNAFNFKGYMGFGIVLLKGKPNLIGQCCVSVIFQRQEDAPINGDAVPIQIVDLSLEGTAPEKPKNGFHYNVSLTLDPTQLPNDTGTMKIYGDQTGGTFVASCMVYIIATFMPTDGGPAIAPFMGNIELNTSLFTNHFNKWTPTPPLHIYLFTAPYPAQQANEHTSKPLNYVDFYISTFVTESGSNDANFAVLYLSNACSVARKQGNAKFWIYPP
jgi:hypothetical protein